MARKDKTKDQVKRLQLRREVLRVLAGDSLEQARGGVGQNGPFESLCQQSRGSE
jgi:hypothetical protein